MKNSIQKILQILNNPEKKQWTFLILCSLLVSMLDIVSIALLLFIIGFYTHPGTYSVLSWLPHRLLDQDSLWLIGLFVVFFVIKSIVAYLVHAAQYEFVYRVALRIAGSKLLSYLEGSYPNFVKLDSSVHIRSISQQPIEFSQYVLAGTQLIITESILIILSIVAILLYNAKIFLLLFIILLPAVIMLALFTRRRLKSVRMHVKESGEKALQYLKEALAGYVESNIYGKHNFFVNRYSGYQERLNNYLSDLQVTQGIPSRIIEVVAVLGLFILIAINKIGGSTNTIDLISIGAFMAAAYKIIPGIVKILNTNGQIKAYSFTTDQLLKTVDHETNTTEAVTAINTIEFEDISFSHHTQRILSNFDMAINKGEMIGISGDSGIGKTTVVNLVLGFLKPDDGVIRINNHMVTDRDELKTYWPLISYVKQQAFLIHDSIVKNITFDERDIDEEKLSQTISVSGLNKILETLPGGIKKIVAENGKDLSGGQRQKIAIARALYKDPDLFILDEPFNELDEISENLLLQHFKNLSQQGKMVILITHNKNSLAFCDRIISLNYATA